MFRFFVTGIIPSQVQLITVIISVLALVVIVELIREGRLREGYALVWFTIPIITLGFALFPNLLLYLAGVFGITYAPSAFLIILVGGVYLLGIHFSLLLHRHNNRIRRLAQEHAILKEELMHNLKEWK